MNVVEVLSIIVVMLVFQLSQATEADLNAVTKRSTTPTKTCSKDNEGESIYNPVNPHSIWLCKNSSWKPYELMPSLGKTRELSPNNCKEIKEAFSTHCIPPSGVYWVQKQQIYCDMVIDGGGWTLVWKHTYMNFKPLHSKMFYFSKGYQPCVKNASHEDWCNVPNKAYFNSTEQMIVAYHKGTIVYAYKGYFNRNIDYHWTGAILLDAKKVIDRCTRSIGVPPSPSVHHSGIFGLNFDKVTPTNHYVNCDTYYQGSTLTKPIDCRWHDCYLPTSISSKKASTDMTVAIFVR